MILSDQSTLSFHSYVLRSMPLGNPNPNPLSIVRAVEFDVAGALKAMSRDDGIQERKWNTLESCVVCVLSDLVKSCAIMLQDGSSSLPLQLNLTMLSSKKRRTWARLGFFLKPVCCMADIIILQLIFGSRRRIHVSHRQKISRCLNHITRVGDVELGLDLEFA